MTQRFLVYLLGNNGSPTCLPEDTKYFENEKDLKDFEKTCKENNEIYESFDLYDVKKINFD